MKNVLVSLWAPYQKRQIFDFRIDKHEHFKSNFIIGVIH